MTHQHEGFPQQGCSTCFRLFLLLLGGHALNAIIYMQTSLCLRAGDRETSDGSWAAMQHNNARAACTPIVGSSTSAIAARYLWTNLRHSVVRQRCCGVDDTVMQGQDQHAQMHASGHLTGAAKEFNIQVSYTS